MMLSDIPTPTDHSRLFSDPAELARWADKRAQYCLKMFREAETPSEKSAWSTLLDGFEERARYYRCMAARGEQVPEF